MHCGSDLCAFEKTFLINGRKEKLNKGNLCDEPQCPTIVTNTLVWNFQKF
jgi:hypothetical protein